MKRRHEFGRRFLFKSDQLHGAAGSSNRGRRQLRIQTLTGDERDGLAPIEVSGKKCRREQIGHGEVGRGDDADFERALTFHDKIQNLAGNVNDALERFSRDERTDAFVCGRESDRVSLREADGNEGVTAMFAVHLEHELHL